MIYITLSVRFYILSVSQGPYGIYCECSIPIRFSLVSQTWYQLRFKQRCGWSHWLQGHLVLDQIYLDNMYVPLINSQHIPPKKSYLSKYPIHLFCSCKDQCFYSNNVSLKNKKGLLIAFRMHNSVLVGVSVSIPRLITCSPSNKQSPYAVSVKVCSNGS